MILNFESGSRSAPALPSSASKKISTLKTPTKLAEMTDQLMTEKKARIMRKMINGTKIMCLRHDVRDQGDNSKIKNKVLQMFSDGDNVVDFIRFLKMITGFMYMQMPELQSIESYVRSCVQRISGEPWEMMSQLNCKAVLTAEGSRGNHMGKTLYTKYKEFIAWHVETFRNELRFPTYGGFISIGGVLLGDPSCLWEVEGSRAQERCIAALGLVKQSNAGLRTGFKRDPAQKKVKGLLTHLLLVMSEVGITPQSVQDKTVEEICGKYVTVYCSM
jgi:hypothetical protein